MIRGCDVSRYQGLIDWPSVAKATTPDGLTIKFVGIKASQGVNETDPCFRRNMIGARAAGLIVLPYHFFDPLVDAVAQARHFLNQLTSADFPCRLVLDCEQTLGWDQFDAVARATMVGKCLDTLQEACTGPGKRPMFYTNAPFSDEYLQAFAGGIYDLWLARYAPTVPAGWREYKIWQDTEKGSLPGIEGPVDLDRFEGLPGELLAMCATGIKV